MMRPWRALVSIVGRAMSASLRTAFVEPLVADPGQPAAVAVVRCVACYYGVAVIPD